MAGNLAQSFNIKPNAGIGVFLTKLNVYFSQKDVNFGVRLQIREVINGVVSNQVPPFGSVSLTSDEVNVSSDASIPTSFYFHSPVLLSGNKEYAFTIKPVGNSDRYRVWCAELGNSDILTQKIVAKQPATGVLHTSTNDNQYNNLPNEDIKFDLHVAYFDTSVTGTARFQNQLLDKFTITGNSSAFQSGEQIRGASQLEVISLPTFGGNSNSMITSSVAVGDQVRGLTTGAVGVVRQINVATSNALSIIVDSANVFSTNETIKISSSSISNKQVFGKLGANGYSGNSTVSNTSTAVFESYSPKYGTMVVNSSTGTFSSNLTQYTGWVRGQTTNTAAQITAITDFKVNIISPRLSVIDYSNTSLVIKNAIASNNGLYTNGSMTSVGIGKSNEYEDEKVIGSYSNANKRTYFVEATLNSPDVSYSPVIDLKSSPSAVAIQNIINVPYANDQLMQVGESIAGGNSSARYISIPITLADGQDAEDLKVYVTAYKPLGANVHVFAKIKAANDPETLDDKHYTLLSQITPANVISSSSRSDDFRSFEYGFPSGANAVGNNTLQSAYLFTGNNSVVRYHDDGGATYDTIKTFTIKVVLSGNNSAIVPRVTDLRAVALQK
jgi:hypothetical protein